MTAGLGRRARNFQEVGINFQAMMCVAPVKFVPLETRPTDVFISPWAKSGTTMMQQMFHQLRMAAATGAGDMDFDDISRVVPWEDGGALADYDVNGPQRAEPRGFKSHRDYERLPPGLRYVVTLRDPKDTYVSFYRFFSGWHFEPGSVSLDEFFPLWIYGGPGGCDYATHLLSWYARRDEPDTLLATYRSAVRDRPKMVRRLADFLGIAVTDDEVDLIADMTSRDFMHAHKDRFDDRILADAFAAKVGVPADSDSAKVQAKGSDGNALPPSVAEKIDAMWAERIAPVTGHSDFASLAAELDARA